jgi:hypothetical protein
MIDAAPILHEFACLCAENLLKLIPKPIDSRLPSAIMAKRAWLAGKISTKELSAASAVARDVASAVASAVAWDVDSAVASAVARAAASAAASAVARDVASAVARAAASAVSSAGASAVSSAGASAVAWDVARAAQNELLTSMVEAEMAKG